MTGEESGEPSSSSSSIEGSADELARMQYARASRSMHRGHPSSKSRMRAFTSPCRSGSAGAILTIAVSPVRGAFPLACTPRDGDSVNGKQLVHPGSMTTEAMNPVPPRVRRMPKLPSLVSTDLSVE